MLDYDKYRKARVLRPGYKAFVVNHSVAHYLLDVVRIGLYDLTAFGIMVVIAPGL